MPRDAAKNNMWGIVETNIAIVSGTHLLHPPIKVDMFKLIF